VPPLLQQFADLFWKYGLAAERSGAIRGTHFSRHRLAPRVLLIRDETRPESASYTPLSHSISVNAAHAAVDGLQARWNALKARGGSSMRDDPALSSIVGLEKHSSCLMVHELTHAWSSTDHSGHSDISLTISGDSQTLPYEYAAVAVHSYFVQTGFLADLFAQT